jgi:hypothetical protein
VIVKEVECGLCADYLYIGELANGLSRTGQRDSAKLSVENGKKTPQVLYRNSQRPELCFVQSVKTEYAKVVISYLQYALIYNIRDMS